MLVKTSDVSLLHLIWMGFSEVLSDSLSALVEGIGAMCSAVKNPTVLNVIIVVFMMKYLAPLIQALACLSWFI